MRNWRKSFQRPSDFNEVNKELRALTSINDVGGRFINSASKYWWAYQIAFEFKAVDPMDVKYNWYAEDILEALAAIGLANKNRPSNPK